MTIWLAVWGQRFRMSRQERTAVRIEQLGASDDLFGVDASVFAEILELGGNAVSCGIRRVDAIDPAFYGGRGEKAILEVSYQADGSTKSTRFFVKRHCSREQNEAVHYLHLTQAGAPIPRLFAYYSHPNEQDIIVTEALDPFHVDDDPAFMSDREVMEPFVAATAGFCGTQVSAEYRQMIAKKCDLVRDQIWPYRSKLQNMYEEIKRDPLHRSLKRKVPAVAEAAVQRLLAVACERMQTMERGLYHWDHKPRNMGWSSLQQRHVIFDLEDTLWGPRFFNIGMWIGGDDGHEPKYASREQLAVSFLDLYNAATGQTVSVETLLEECYPIWVAYKIETLLVYFGECGARPYRRRSIEPEQYRSEMQNKFLGLMDLLCGLQIS